MLFAILAFHLHPRHIIKDITLISYVRGKNPMSWQNAVSTSTEVYHFKVQLPPDCLSRSSGFLFSRGSAIVTAFLFAFTESNLFIGWILAASGNDIACGLWAAFPPASHGRLFGRIFLQARLHRLFPEISSPSPPRGLEECLIEGEPHSCGSHRTLDYCVLSEVNRIHWLPETRYNKILWWWK